MDHQRKNLDILINKLVLILRTLFLLLYTNIFLFTKPPP